MALNFSKRSKKFKIFFILGILFVLSAVGNLGNQSENTNSTKVEEKIKEVSPQEQIIRDFFSKNEILGTITTFNEKDGIYFANTNISKFSIKLNNNQISNLYILGEESVSFPIQITDGQVDKEMFDLALNDKLPKLVEEAQLTKKIESQFSLWDGSHKNLVDIVKKNLNDPKSFEHVETKYVYDKEKNTITLGMQFRAKNSFNALVLNTALATADLDGNILSLDIQ